MSNSDPSVAQAQTAATVQLIADVQAAVVAAQAEGGAPLASPAQAAAAQAFITQANSLVLDLQASLVPQQSPTRYVVQDGDTVMGLAQRFLGDPTLFGSILTLNGMHGLYIATGSVLQIPATGAA